MCTISIPASVLCADSNSLNPVVIVILLLFQVRIPAVLAPLLSILIMRGFPLLPITLLRNFCADPFILRLVSKKPIVFPCLSTARYKFLSLSPALIYVSSSLQLSVTD